MKNEKLNNGETIGSIQKQVQKAYDDISASISAPKYTDLRKIIAVKEELESFINTAERNEKSKERELAKFEELVIEENADEEIIEDEIENTASPVDEQVTTESLPPPASPSVTKPIKPNPPTTQRKVQSSEPEPPAFDPKANELPLPLPQPQKLKPQPAITPMQKQQSAPRKITSIKTKGSLDKIFDDVDEKQRGIIASVTTSGAAGADGIIATNKVEITFQGGLTATVTSREDQLDWSVNKQMLDVTKDNPDTDQYKALQEMIDIAVKNANPGEEIEISDQLQPEVIELVKSMIDEAIGKYFKDNPPKVRKPEAATQVVNLVKPF